MCEDVAFPALLLITACLIYCPPLLFFPSPLLRHSSAGWVPPATNILTSNTQYVIHRGKNNQAPLLPSTLLHPSICVSTHPLSSVTPPPASGQITRCIRTPALWGLLQLNERQKAHGVSWCTAVGKCNAH